MLLSELNDTRKKLSQLEKKENAIQNAEKKAKNDDDYAKLIKDFFDSMNLAKHVYDEMGYALSIDTIKLAEDIYSKLNEIIEYGLVDEDLLLDAKKQNRQLNNKLVEEWSIFYKRKSSSAIGKLNTIGILVFDRNQIDQIKNDIFDSSNWNNLSKKKKDGTLKIEGFKSSVDKISKIEENLKLNSNISTFIMKVSQGKARITDLNEEILSWIKEKELDDKFLIHFK